MVLTLEVCENPFSFVKSTLRAPFTMNSTDVTLTSSVAVNSRVTLSHDVNLKMKEMEII